MPVITGFLARTFAGFLNILTGFAFWGSTPDGVVEPGIVVGMGLLVSATSFVIMAVLLYVAHHHYCNCLRSVFSSCRRRYMLTLTLFMSKRSAVIFLPPCASRRTLLGTRHPPCIPHFTPF